ncbi:methyltransferase domain-containing protein [Candidatus Shapirobacteria bacterium]|nr:methyltransferase domain-containing protein [Candidatus Shapirobacteria bacterium]
MITPGKRYENFHNRIHIQRKPIGVENFTYRNIINVLLKYLGSFGSSVSILDVGCGVGTLDFFLASRGVQVRGVDISATAISACRESAKAMSLENRLSFATMKFPLKALTGKYDVILCSEVLEHLRKDEIAIESIKRLLKEKGIAIITVPSVNAPLFKLGLAREFDRRVGHLRRYSVKELIGLCERGGFKTLEVRREEGILRNFLFLNRTASNFIRFIKGPISDLVSLIDGTLVKLFGESQIILVTQKT